MLYHVDRHRSKTLRCEDIRLLIGTDFIVQDCRMMPEAYAHGWFVLLLVAPILPVCMIGLVRAVSSCYVRILHCISRIAADFRAHELKVFMTGDIDIIVGIRTERIVPLPALSGIHAV